MNTQARSVFEDPQFAEPTWVCSVIVLFTERNSSGVWFQDKNFPFCVTDVSHYETTPTGEHAALKVDFLTTMSPVLQQLELQASGLNFAAHTYRQAVNDDDVPLLAPQPFNSGEFRNSRLLFSLAPTPTRSRESSSSAGSAQIHPGNQYLLGETLAQTLFESESTDSDN